MSTSLACTLPYPGEKHLAITSEDCNQAVCYPDTITWTLDNLLLMIVFLTEGMVPKQNPLSGPLSSFLTLLTLQMRFLLQLHFQRRKKTLEATANCCFFLIIIINEYFTLPLNSRYWEAISRWNEAISLTPKNEKLYEMKSQVRLRVEEVRGTGSQRWLTFNINFISCWMFVDSTEGVVD